MRRVAPAAYTIGEVWDSVGAREPYYPDELDSHFAFELSEALLEAVRTGKIDAGEDPAGRWLAGFARWLMGTPG